MDSSVKKRSHPDDEKHDGKGERKVKVSQHFTSFLSPKIVWCLIFENFLPNCNLKRRMKEYQDLKLFIAKASLQL